MMKQKILESHNFLTIHEFPQQQKIDSILTRLYYLYDKKSMRDLKVFQEEIQNRFHFRTFCMFKLHTLFIDWLDFHSS